MKDETVCDVFLAYSSDAREFSERLASRLRLAELEVFFDAHTLEAGAAFDPVIRRAVARCRAFLFVISRGSVAHQSYPRTELAWALAARRPLFAIRAAGHDDVAPPPNLDGVSPITGDGNPFADAVGAILKHVEGARALSARQTERTKWTRRVLLGSGGVLLSALAVYTMGEETRPTTQVPTTKPLESKDVSAASGLLEPVAPDMVRFAARSGHFGISGAPFKEWCASLALDPPSCNELVVRAPPYQAEVPSFDLDREEVTAEDFLAWAQRRIRDGAAVLDHGLVKSVRGDSLWDPFCHEYGSYQISKQAIVPRPKEWRALFGPRQPVSCVSAEAAASYCRDAGKRLPTESEWELAAGGANEPRRWFPWSDDRAERPACGDAIFARSDAGACASLPNWAAPVDNTGRLDVTPEGVRALGGNVSEWVTKANGASQTDQFTFRGGSWAGPVVDMHPAKRTDHEQTANDVALVSVGFRCAKTPEPRPASGQSAN